MYAGSDSPTAMVYGPYDTTYGQGHHTAQFKLMVDNNSGSDVVGSLDVVTGFGGNVLATRQVRRSDFTSANQWQTFTLQFDNPCFGLFEARVWWAGNANLKFAQLTITPLEVATSGVQWLVTDQLGTPRMVFDKTGSLSGVRRHDYLPFGEELYVGGRTAPEGYNTDNVRQHFTGYEADGETGLNYAQARYQSPVQGRFTSVDPLGRSANVLNPQSFNRYSYVLNNPTNSVDPQGLMTMATQPDPSVLTGTVVDDDPLGDPFETGRDIIGATETRYTIPSIAEPWPPATHDSILAESLKEFNLSPEELNAVQLGSREVDWGDSRTDDGEPFNTLKVRQAYLHAMVPKSWVDQFGLQKATQMAIDAAAKFTTDQLELARNFMRSANRAVNMKLYTENRMKALFHFGMAMHPHMDAMSPEHQWKVYGLSGEPFTDLNGLRQHRNGEARQPNKSEMAVMKQQIQMFYKRTF